MPISNFRTKVVQVTWGCLVSHFLRFLQADYHPSCLHHSFHARFLILAHLMMLRILSRRMLPVIHFLISAVPSSDDCFHSFNGVGPAQILYILILLPELIFFLQIVWRT
jgi:hypothetical protein